MAFKTIIGQVARGNDFYPRPKITDQIWDKVEAGSHLLMVAPRRVGKSSILFHLLDSPKPNYCLVYYISESVNNENEFFKKLLNHVVDALQGVNKYSQKMKIFAKSLVSRIEQIGKNGVTLGERKLNYFNEFVNLIKNQDFDTDRLVILVDEFAQTVENILQDEGISSAINFLQSNRTLRLMPEFHKKIQFIYAGSIGLENIVARINSVQTINDLVLINVSPLTREEVTALSQKIIMDSDIKFEEKALDYLINKIEWLIPFYIQLIMDESYEILQDRNTRIITQAVIDEAIQNAIKHRNHFEHWFTRLRKAYKGPEFNFVKQVLNIASEKHAIFSTDIFNIAVEHKLEDSYRDILNALKHDGYINNNENPKIYRFNSPILEIWWNQNVAN